MNEEKKKGIHRKNIGHPFLFLLLLMTFVSN